jgi:MFS family permease
MLTSITPLGERGRGRRWGATATFYVIGSVAGGALVGLLFGTVGRLVPQTLRPPGFVLLGIVVTALVLVAAFEAKLLGGLPTIHRQVNEDWLDQYRGWVIGGGFGFQLGFGLATMVTSAMTYAMLLLAMLTFSPLLGTAVGAVFGLARALPILLTGGIRNPQTLLGFHRRMAAFAPVARQVVTASSCLMAAALVTGGVIA